MATGGHFGCPKITFNRISGHFRQNGCRRPFCMPKIHFWLHFWPFQIDRPFLISKNSLLIAILAISDQYRFFFSAAILDIQKSLWITFLAISNRSAILDVRNSWHFYGIYGIFSKLCRYVHQVMGVSCIVFDIDGMLFEFFMNFLNI